jgi:hypothetical protein
MEEAANIHPAKAEMEMRTVHFEPVEAEMEMQTCREVAQRLVYEFYTARYDEPET